MPSWNPTAFDRLKASMNNCFALSRFPAISANSPKLWVVTAHARSHSSVLSGGSTDRATVRALWAHNLACSRRSLDVEVLALELEDGASGESGFCSERDMAMLFTGRFVRVCCFEEVSSTYLKPLNGKMMVGRKSRLARIMAEHTQASGCSDSCHQELQAQHQLLHH